VSCREEAAESLTFEALRHLLWPTRSHRVQPSCEVLFHDLSVRVSECVGGYGRRAWLTREHGIGVFELPAHFFYFVDCRIAE
jgi:hypothetical protein